MGYKFELRIEHPDGRRMKASFEEASGLERRSRKLQGLRKYSNITLKRGYTADSSLSDWHSQVQGGKFRKAEASVVLRDASRKTVKRWKLSQAWPVKYQPAKLNAKGSDVAIETLELRNEGLVLDDGD